MRLVVNIDVPDLHAAVGFYCAALGLEHTRTLDDDVAELSGAATTIYLLQKDAASAATRTGVTRDYQRHWTPVHVDFVVEDVHAAAARAIAAGARQEGACIEWRGSQCISFADPFGNGFCLIEFATGNYRD